MKSINITGLIKRRYWVIGLTVVVMLVVVAMAQPYIRATYSSSSVLRIEPQAVGSPSYQQLIYLDRLINTYMHVATNSVMIRELKERLGLDSDYPLDLAVEVIPDTNLIRITVKDLNPTLSQDAANLMAEMLINVQPAVDYRIEIVEVADLPQPPSPLRTLLFYALAGMIGLCGGFVLAYWFEWKSTNLYSAEEIIEVSSLKILGYIPQLRSRLGIDIFSIENPFIFDAFRRLRTSILLTCQNEDLKILLVSSAEPRDGKSTIVNSLAKSLAQAEKSVVVVDADFYLSIIHNIFQLPNNKGLQDILGKGLPYQDAIQNTEIPLLKVITSGPPASLSADFLSSSRMSVLLEQLRRDFDIVLIDSPAVLSLADAAVLSPLVDGVLLVVCQNHTKAEVLKAAKEQLTMANANLIGVIVNRASRNTTYYGNYYYSHLSKQKPQQTILSLSQKLFVQIRALISVLQISTKKIFDSYPVKSALTRLRR